MEKINKNILMIIVLFICISFIFDVISAQDSKESPPTDFGKSMGLKEGEITGSGIKYSKGTLTFDQEDSDLNIKGNEFKNIQSQSEAKHPSYVKIDEKTGNIISADFTTNDKGGTYVLGGTKFDVPPNSRVVYNKEGVQFPEKTNITQIGGVEKISGDNLILPGGKTMSGTLSYKDGQAYIQKKSSATINGIEIKSTEGDTNLFFDGNKHKGKYVSFGDKNMIFSADDKKELLLNFKEGNPYLKIDKGDSVIMQLAPNANIEIQNRDDLKKIPKVTVEGDFIMDEDSKSIQRIKGEEGEGI